MVLLDWFFFGRIFRSVHLALFWGESWRKWSFYSLLALKGYKKSRDVAKVKHFSFFQSSYQIRLTPSFQVLELLRVERASILDPGNPDCKRAMVQPSTTMATDMMVKNFFIAQCFAIWLYSFIFVHLGEFHNGFKHGYGKFTVTTNNDVYTGTFDRGVRHGEVGI